MERALKDLRGDAIVARDGRIGSLDDVFFDDREWSVRYLVVDTGNWLPGRQVLISPHSVQRDAQSKDAIALDLTREQVEGSPGLETDQPVSRQFEEAHARYYGYMQYLAATGATGAVMPPPPSAARDVDRGELERAKEAARQSHLRSSRAIAGYRIEAADGELGHVEDFVVDEDRWAISDLVVDTRNWLPGKKVLVPPSAVEDIDWESRKVRVRLARRELKEAPAA